MQKTRASSKEYVLENKDIIRVVVKHLTTQNVPEGTIMAPE